MDGRNVRSLRFGSCSIGIVRPCCAWSCSGDHAKPFARRHYGSSRTYVFGCEHDGELCSLRSVLSRAIGEWARTQKEVPSSGAKLNRGSQIPALGQPPTPV